MAMRILQSALYAINKIPAESNCHALAVLLYVESSNLYFIKQEVISHG